MAQSMLPAFTEPFRRREMMQIIGNRDLDYDQTLDEIKSQSLEQTREELASMQEFEKNAKAAHKTFEPTVSEEMLFTKLNITDREIRELHHLAKCAEQVYTFLQEHHYEIDHHFTTADSLKMIGVSCKDMGLDVGQLLDGKSSPQMKHNGEFAHFLWQFQQSLHDIASEEPMDVVKFIEE